MAYIATTVEEAVQAEESVNPPEIYAKAWQEIANLYVDPGFNGQNWTDWEHKFDNKLMTPEESYLAIQTMAASLNDPYTRIARPAASQNKTEPESSANIAAGMGDCHVSSKLLDKDIGYIKIASFASPGCAQEFKQALKQFESSPSLILDLRGNKGGLVVIALQIADMLL